MKGGARVAWWTGTGACLVTFAAHTLGQLQGPQPARNDTERELLRLMSTHTLGLPGAPDRTMLQLLDGFSWVFSLYFLTIGATAIALRRLRADDASLLRGFAGVQAASLALCLVISLGCFFVIPTVCIAVAAAGFAAAALWPVRG